MEWWSWLSIGIFVGLFIGYAITMGLFTQALRYKLRKFNINTIKEGMDKLDEILEQES